jgi:hypothetical protein
MPAHLGIEKAEIVSSINDALALLETYSPGPATQKHIDALRTGNAGETSPLGAIAAAKNDVELAQAIQSSGVKWLFQRTHEVLMHHAVQDTDKKGLAILTRLTAWNAAGGATTMNYNKVDEEAQTWLAVQTIRNQTNLTHNEATGRIYAVRMGLSDDASTLNSAHRAVAKMYDQAHNQGASDEAIAKTFLALDLRERHIARSFIDAIGKDDNAPKIELNSPIGRYGVIIESMSGPDAQPVPPFKVYQTFANTAIRFSEVGEVEQVAIGIIDPEHLETSPRGITFHATKRVAEAVASALPDHRVIASTGEEIVPPAPPKTVKAPKTQKKL